MVDHATFAMRRGNRRVGLDVVDEENVVQADLCTVAAHGDGHLKPSVVPDEGFIDVADAIERGRLLALAIVSFADVSIVDLDLEALVGKSILLELRVEVDAGVAAFARHDVGLELEVLEVAVAEWAGVKEVRARAIGGNQTVRHSPRAGVLARFPTVERTAIEQGSPVVGGARRRGEGPARWLADCAWRSGPAAGRLWCS